MRNIHLATISFVAFGICCNIEEPKSVFEHSYENVSSLKRNGFKELKTIRGGQIISEHSGMFRNVIGDTVVDYHVSENEIIKKEISFNLSRVDTAKIFALMKSLGYQRIEIDSNFNRKMFVKSKSRPYYVFNNKKYLYFDQEYKKAGDIPVDSTERIK